MVFNYGGRHAQRVLFNPSLSEAQYLLFSLDFSGSARYSHVVDPDELMMLKLERELAERQRRSPETPPTIGTKPAKDFLESDGLMDEIGY